MLFKKIGLTALALLILIFAQGFFYNPNKALEKVKAQFTTGLEQLDETLLAYEQAVDQLDATEKSKIRLRKLHAESRLAYKNIEFLINYLDPGAVKRTLFGPPLPSVEPNIPEVKTLDPQGFQVLDELVYDESPLTHKAAIKTLLAQLRVDFSSLRPQLSATPLAHRHVFEASRRELIRIFTLGVTGFDTPGESANALPEAAAAFAGIDQAIRAYMPLLDEKDRGLAILLDARLSFTKDYLDNSRDFDNFDRLVFLTKHINPLYDILYEVHRKLGIEMIEEVEKLPQPINYHARNIFDEKFLNTGYYALLNANVPNKDKRIALGRMLFFDPVLSSDNSTSCATCHQPGKAFTDGLPKSQAHHGKNTVKRNAPTLLNCVYSENYFHDLRETQLDRQVMHVVRDSNEFNTTYIEIIGRLALSAEYKALFMEAYPDQASQPLSGYTISNAIAEYVAQLTSFDSPFDQYVTGKTGVIAPEVQRGFNLFMGKAVCGTCHFAPVFNGTVPPQYIESESEVLGTPAARNKNEVDADEGRYANLKPRDHAPFYKYSFKTPTVRNVELTAPYMHNGVYNTLEEVVDFYNKGGGQGLGIKIEHQTLPFDNLELSAQEQKDLVAFMKALTDRNTQYPAPEKLPAFDKKPEWNNRYNPENYK